MAGSASAQIYVDANGPGGSGLDWSTPYNTLQPALTDVSNGVSDTIYVAEGTYRPTSGAGQTATFVVPMGTKIYGGFKNGDPNPQNRTGLVRATALSGDIGTPNDASDNSFHVVTINPGGQEVLLDGLHITGGNAVGGVLVSEQQGAGITCVDSDLQIRGCIFSANAARRGGAIWFDGGSQGDGFRAAESVFITNTATETGGAIDFHDFGIPTVPSPGFTDEPSWIFNCQFLRNLAGDPQSINVILAAQGGGAIHFDNRRNESAAVPGYSPVTMAVANSLFTDNAVRGRGAACWIKPAASGTAVGRVHFASCTIAFNGVLQTDNLFGEGGQVFVEANEVTQNARTGFINSIAYFTMGIGSAQGGNAITGPGSIGSSTQGTNPLSLVALNSDIELLAGGIYGSSATNLNVDPSFIAPASRNLRLGAASLCRNVGTSAVGMALATVFPDYPDLDGFSVTGNPATDPVPLDLFLQQDRVQGTRIDMGCFEFDE